MFKSFLILIIKLPANIIKLLAKIIKLLTKLFIWLQILLSRYKKSFSLLYLGVNLTFISLDWWNK